jgi:hypothetical protein
LKEEQEQKEKDEKEGKEVQEVPLTEAELLKLKVEAMDPVEAAQLLSSGEEETEFEERLLILARMQLDLGFEKQVVANFAN